MRDLVKVLAALGEDIGSKIFGHSRNLRRKLQQLSIFSPRAALELLRFLATLGKVPETSGTLAKVLTSSFLKVHSGVLRFGDSGQISSSY